MTIVNMVGGGGDSIDGVNYSWVPDEGNTYGGTFGSNFGSSVTAISETYVGGASGNAISYSSYRSPYNYHIRYRNKSGSVSTIRSIPQNPSSTRVNYLLAPFYDSEDDAVYTSAINATNSNLYGPFKIVNNALENVTGVSGVVVGHRKTISVSRTATTTVSINVYDENWQNPISHPTELQFKLSEYTGAYMYIMPGNNGVFIKSNSNIYFISTIDYSVKNIRHGCFTLHGDCISFTSNGIYNGTEKISDIIVSFINGDSAYADESGNFIKFSSTGDIICINNEIRSLNTSSGATTSSAYSTYNTVVNFAPGLQNMAPYYQLNSNTQSTGAYAGFISTVPMAVIKGRIV